MRLDVAFMLATFVAIVACSNAKEHTAPAIYDKDSVSLMVSYGVNTLISDSGVIKYRIVTERWDVNTVRQPSRWTFIKGLFMEQFDEHFNVQAYIQADSAWYYDQLKLWELRGRVKVRNLNGMVFTGNELFWDGVRREIYSNKYSRVTSPERTLQGTYFRSNENMTNYTISNSAGSFVKSDIIGEETADDDKGKNGNGDGSDTSADEELNNTAYTTVSDTASAIRQRQMMSPKKPTEQSSLPARKLKPMSQMQMMKVEKNER